MTGTTDLSREQFETIARSVEETGSTVSRIVIHPLTSSPAAKSVRVDFTVLGYGVVHFVVTREGKRLPLDDNEHDYWKRTVLAQARI